MIPLVLLLVFGILVLLLRAVVAPLLLVGTVLLSYVATMGVCGVVFTDIFGFAGAESSFPMYAFVFLVALGVDYNIFLMTRVREEVAATGHRAGTLRGLTVTGGVITSAGIVVAATFSALSVIPLVYLAELAFAVGVRGAAGHVHRAVAARAGAHPRRRPGHVVAEQTQGRRPLGSPG